ncbi:MAG: 50S ribosomal protein L21 [Deltaproteobacteria bacterium]|nr:50S ribosomal protein L21 [Deltaproteobacteria bacterium]
MYAVIRSGGKQHKVSAGSLITLERIKGEVGDPVVFTDVLAVVGDELLLGQPNVADVSIHGTIVAQEKGKKIIVFKKKRRKGYRRTMGHRQLQTRCRIDEIRMGSAPPQAKEEPDEVTITQAPSADKHQET